MGIYKSFKETLEIRKGDITEFECDAVVNAANSRLAGEAVITPAYDMPKAGYIIHTAGPVWRGGASGEAETLSSCYRNSLKIAAEKGLKTVAFPAISTGVYGYPPGKALITALAAVKAHVEGGAGLPEKIVLFFFDENSYQAALKAVSEL